MQHVTVHNTGGSPHAQIPISHQPSILSNNTPKFVCEDCGQFFERKFNLERHKQRKTPCIRKLDNGVHNSTARLLCTVLDVLRGPLNLSEHQAKNDKLVTQILIDLWTAVTLAAEKYPERAYGLVHRLIVEQLNARQVTLLFSVVMVSHRPPTTAMIQTLRALYTQLYHQNESMKHEGNTNRQRIASKLQGMWLLEALR